MHFQTLLSLLLKVPRMELPSSLLWWELDTNILVNDCHSDVLPVNNTDSDAFGYFLRIINWSPVDKSAQQVSNKKSNDIISRDTMHWTSDGFAYLYQWIYSCRIADQFTSNFRSRARLTMPSLSGITFYRNIIRPFWTPGHLACHFGPVFCRFDANSYDNRPTLLSHWSSSQVIWTPWRFRFFKKARPC